ncbi:uncharacterized protein RAG0_12322 [Rhynchosporium agropyri]|uniref:Uncharacterized protein n=1 Tax=Rhynchosporium agropyri TaxID=914238 RepID=A0A1E1L7X2_9HELO|nr:uncharacterized protein RAG0_12322 [Rhynchosporium agropyri]
MNTKSNIMRKLLRQPTATSTPTEIIDISSLEYSKLRPSASQYTVFSAGVPVHCLDRSPDGLRAVIAGSKVFKILRIDGPIITEELDLRAIIISYASTHDPSAATPEQLNIRAVKWSWGDLDSYIVTACGNGRITVYDLNRIGEGLEVGRIQEHVRQVHKLDISPFRNNWLLSASQDGTVRSWDLKIPIQQQGRQGLTFKALATFKCNADAVRDVKWSPTDGMEFACCTDAGVIQKWDIRKVTAPVLKLTAHTSPCFSISWHPDGEHLISGGIDQTCHVWDLSKKGDRTQKPRYTFVAPAPISRVSWRPACWSATAQGKRAAQVAVAYDDSNSGRNLTSTVHIFDLARSSMPFKEIEQWNTAPTSLVWNSRDLLWSVDKEGHFTQTDVAFVPQLINRRSLSTFSFSPMGDVLMMLEARQTPKRPRPNITSPPSSGYNHTSSGPLLSVSRSDSEEDVVGSFLGRRIKKGHRRQHSGRGQSLSTTPPTNIGFADGKVLSLDTGLKVTGTYKPQQVMAIGHAPSSVKREMYQYFSNRYMMRLVKASYPEIHSQPGNLRAKMIMESYARTAENVGHFRLAQTWRLLSFTIGTLLTRRAEFHRQSRLHVKPPSIQQPERDTMTESIVETERGEQTPRRLPGPQPSVDIAVPLNEIPKIQEDIESTSNVATPLVRPVRDQIVHETREAKAMHTPMVIDEELALPEASHPRTPSPIPVPGARQSPDRSSSSLEGYDFYGIDSFSTGIDCAAPVKKAPLRLEYHDQSQHPPRIQPHRHDSNESFQMFSTSADSHGSKFMESSDSDPQSVNQERQGLRERASNWEYRDQHDFRHHPSIDSEAPTEGSSLGDLGPQSLEEQGARNGIPRSPSSPPVFRLLEASAPKDIDNTPVKNHYQDEESPSSPTASEKTSGNPNLIDSDFQPWPNDPDFLIKPLDPIILVQRAIDFEAQTGALNAAAMVLLLRPLLPCSAFDGIQAGAILRQYHNRLISMKLFTEAALLRNLCVPLYPAIFAPSQENITVGYFCTDCNKPIENDPLTPGSVWKCPRCRKSIDACTICQHRELPDDTGFDDGDVLLDSALWWWCTGCGHGGHTACMQAWHAGAEFEEGDKYSGGCCPLEGCLHPCLPGKWRDRRVEGRKAIKARELDLLVRENSRQGNRGTGGRPGVPIRRDAREVKQSSAVEGVRVALNGFSGSSRGLERKKSVRLIVPEDE